MAACLEIVFAAGGNWRWVCVCCLLWYIAVFDAGRQQAATVARKALFCSQLKATGHR